MAGRTSSREIYRRAATRMFVGHGGRKQRKCSRIREGIKAKKRSEGIKLFERYIILVFCLKSGKHKCLKAKHGVIGHNRQDRARKKK